MLGGDTSTFVLETEPQRARRSLAPLRENPALGGAAAATRSLRSTCSIRCKQKDNVYRPLRAGCQMNLVHWIRRLSLAAHEQPSLITVLFSTLADVNLCSLIGLVCL